MAAYYFAYGINMDKDHLVQLCPGAVPISPAVLEDHRFMINEPGWATVVPERETAVHGLLWRVGDACLEQLDEFEGVGEGLYQREKARVRTPAGETSAEIYIARNRAVGVPGIDYIERIAKAAAMTGAPADYLGEIDGWREKAAADP